MLVLPSVLVEMLYSNDNQSSLVESTAIDRSVKC